MVRTLAAAACLATGFGVHSASISLEGSEFLPAGRTVGDQTHPALAVGSTRSVLVWEENTDGDGNAIRARLLGAQFSGLTAGTYVNTTTAGDQEHAACASLPSGDFFIAWQSGIRGSQRIIGRILGNDGVFKTGELEISAGVGARDPKVAIGSDSTITVVWTQSGIDADMDAVVARNLTTAGVPQGAPVRLNVVEAFNQRDPAVASLPDGSVFVAWVSEDPAGDQSAAVIGRKFGSSLSPASGEIRLTSGKNPCASPALVRVSDRLLLAWSEFQMDAPDQGWDLQAKPISYQGMTLASARRMTAKSAGDQGELSLVSNGEIALAAFTGGALDGSGKGIGVQILDSNAGAMDTDLVANTTKRQHQVRPVIGINPAGAALVVWVGFGSSESGVDLYGQRIGKPGAELAPPSAPVAVALSSSKIRVACPDSIGLPVSKYLVFVDGSATPIESVSPYVTVGALAPESDHGFSVALLMQDGRITPKSPEQRAVTWSEDDNADGLPDSWQRAHFGTNSAQWPPVAADSDGDGKSNREEFLAGTNPTDAASVLRTTLAATSLGTVITWNSQPGGLYQVQASADLLNWSDVGGIRLASGRSESVLLQDAPANSYFRVNCLR